MEKIRAIIVDDEPHASKTLMWEIGRLEVDIEILAIYNDPEEALKNIPNFNLDLLFLDVEMPMMNGFDLLKALDKKDFGVIFVTAYDKFALKAIKVSALDYLLKPVDTDELRKGIQKFQAQRDHFKDPRQLDLLFDRLSGKTMSSPKIALPTSEGLTFVEPQKICHCASESNYTRIFFENGSKMIISKTLKDVEELLDDQGFLRVHHSHLVNTKFIEKYVKGAGGYLLLTDGSSINVSRSRKEDLLNYFQSR